MTLLASTGGADRKHTLLANVGKILSTGGLLDLYEKRRSVNAQLAAIHALSDLSDWPLKWKERRLSKQRKCMSGSGVAARVKRSSR